MPLLTAEQILAAEDILHEDVPCPEWGGDVRVVTLSGEELDEFRSQYKVANDAHYNKGFCEELTNKYIFLAHVCRDESGQRVFSDPASLEKKSGAVVDRLFRVALRLNGYGDDEKNSLKGESGGTGTPVTSV